MKIERKITLYIFFIIFLTFLGSCKNEQETEEVLSSEESITEEKTAELPEETTTAKEEIETVTIEETTTQEIGEEVTGFQDEGDFYVVYSDVENPDYLVYEDLFKERQIFETEAQALNSFFLLPYDIFIELGECGEENAFYSSEYKEIVICYELIDSISQTYGQLDFESEEELDTAILSSLYFIFYHELGHALIDIYELPITGKEEDVADQISTVILSELGDPKIALNGGFYFLIHWFEIETTEEAYADSHSLDIQRYYYIACLVYGKDPENYYYIIEEDLLPVERAENCPEEYEKSLNSINYLLSPYITTSS